MLEQRDFLLQALREVIAGGDIDLERIDAAISQPEKLKGPAFKAYWGLRYWADDGDIRKKDSAYAPMRREGLARLLHKLEADNLG
jgi:hypothetical protein